MRRKQFRVLGVMSGTSLDGIDLAYLAFTRENGWEASILKAETIPYPQKWVEVLKASAELSRPDIAALDEHYTDYLAEVIQQFIQKNKIEKLDAVQFQQNLTNRPQLKPRSLSQNPALK